MGDQDLSNTLNAKEASKMMLDITGHKKISSQHVEDFINHIEKKTFEATGQKPNGVLEKKELLHFIEHGIQLDGAQREAFAKRGPFQKTLVAFFIGCDKLMDEIC